MVAQAAQDPPRVIGIIFGPPGSGKGTQAARIEKDFHLKHLSTGDILRAEVATGTPTGQEAGRIMAAGDLVPDELIVDIVRSRLPEAETGAGVLLDGFPRTLRQAQALDAMLAGEGSRWTCRRGIWSSASCIGPRSRADPTTRARRSPSGCMSTTSSPRPCSTTTAGRGCRSRSSAGWGLQTRFSSAYGGSSA